MVYLELILIFGVAALGLAVWAGFVQSQHPPATEFEGDPAMERELEDAIDLACRGPFAFAALAAAGWLFVGTLLAAFAAFQLIFPGIWGSGTFSFLNYGRIQPAWEQIMVYGFGGSAALGLSIWLTARLASRPPMHPKMLAGAMVLWNCGVLAGIYQILFGPLGGIPLITPKIEAFQGAATGIPLLEFPGAVLVVLLVAFGFVALEVIRLFLDRREGPVYVSMWYLLASVLWFMWSLGSASFMLVWSPVSGAVQPVIAAWFAHAVIWLWLMPVGLAAAYYILPKTLRVPLQDYGLAAVGFWSYGVLMAWSGPHRLIGGPAPLWVQGLSVAAVLASVLPFLILGINLLGTASQRKEAVSAQIDVWYVVAGVMAMLMAALGNWLFALSWFSEAFNHSMVSSALSVLTLFGALGLLLCGGILFVLPEVLGWAWSAIRMLALHFWITVLAFGFIVVVQGLAGLFEGFAQRGFNLETPIPYRALIAYREPFLYAQLVGWVLALFGQLVLVVATLQMALRRFAPWVRTTLTGPIDEPAAHEVKA